MRWTKGLIYHSSVVLRARQRASSTLLHCSSAVGSVSCCETRRCCLSCCFSRIVQVGVCLDRLWRLWCLLGLVSTLSFGRERVRSIDRQWVVVASRAVTRSCRGVARLDSSRLRGFPVFINVAKIEVGVVGLLLGGRGHDFQGAECLSGCCTYDGSIDVGTLPRSEHVVFLRM